MPKTSQFVFVHRSQTGIACQPLLELPPCHAIYGLVTHFIAGFGHGPNSSRRTAGNDYRQVACHGLGTLPPVKLRRHGLVPVLVAARVMTRRLHSCLAEQTTAKHVAKRFLPLTFCELIHVLLASKNSNTP